MIELADPEPPAAGSADHDEAAAPILAPLDAKDPVFALSGILYLGSISPKRA